MNNKKLFSYLLAGCAIVGTSLISMSIISLQPLVAEAADQNLTPHKRNTPVDLITPQKTFPAGQEVKVIEFFINQQSGQMQSERLGTVRADSGGVARFHYTVAPNPIKGSTQVQFTDDRKSFVFNVPIGQATPSAPVEQANFPMKFGSGDVEVAHKFWMRTNVKMEKTTSGGRLSATTVGWNRNRVQGYTVGVEVAVLDKNDSILFITPLRKWGINGTVFPGRDSFTANWSDSLPQDVIAKARKIAIVQRHTPTNRLPSVLRKLQDIKQIVQAIQDAVLIVSSLL